MLTVTTKADIMAASDEQRARIIDLSLAFSQCPSDDDDPNTVFNALALTLIAFTMSFLAAQGKPITQENVAQRIVQFAMLTEMEASRLLSDQDAQRLLADAQNSQN